MGIGTSCVVKRFCKHQMKILMLGLDASGTTTILYKLKLGQIVCTIPTIGFNVETVEFNNLRFSVWDLGGQDKGLIFVVDSSDKERIIEARNQLHQILCEDALCNAAVFIFANKQDLPSAMCLSEVANKLGLHLIRQHRWYIQDASALSPMDYTKVFSGYLRVFNSATSLHNRLKNM